MSLPTALTQSLATVDAEVANLTNTMDSSTLDHALQTLESEIARLHTLIPMLRSSLLSLPAVSTALANAPASTRSLDAARNALAAQQSHNEETTYRLTAGISAFRVQDPDPRAVDGGRVLGLRVESPQGASFGTPYFVFLVAVENGGAEDSVHDEANPRLKVKHHTVPASILLEALARKHLPLPHKDGQATRKQNVHGFARALRHEIVSYHKRREAITQLRESVVHKAFNESAAAGKKRKWGLFTAIESDEAARVVDITMSEGTRARVQVSKTGEIEGVAVSGGDGEAKEGKSKRARIRRRIEGGDGRIEGLAKRLLNMEKEGD